MDGSFRQARTIPEIGLDARDPTSDLYWLFVTFLNTTEGMLTQLFSSASVRCLSFQRHRSFVSWPEVCYVVIHSYVSLTDYAFGNL